MYCIYVFFLFFILATVIIHRFMRMEQTFLFLSIFFDTLYIVNVCTNVVRNIPLVPMHKQCSKYIWSNECSSLKKGKFLTVRMDSCALNTAFNMPYKHTRNLLSTIPFIPDDFPPLNFFTVKKKENSPTPTSTIILTKTLCDDESE